MQNASFAMPEPERDGAALHAVGSHELARGIDRNPVVSNRVRKQISAEDTFEDDIPLSECVPHIRKLGEKVWKASKENARGAKTIVLKLKTKQFQSMTRSLTSRMPISSCELLVDTILALCERVDLPKDQLYCLIGVGLSNFQFEEEAAADAEKVDVPSLIIWSCRSANLGRV
jgi:DNA polymerase IV